jgi:hypothetical protein
LGQRDLYLFWWGGRRRASFSAARGTADVRDGLLGERGQGGVWCSHANGLLSDRELGRTVAQEGPAAKGTITGCARPTFRGIT